MHRGKAAPVQRVDLRRKHRGYCKLADARCGLRDGNAWSVQSSNIRDCRRPNFARLAHTSSCCGQNTHILEAHSRSVATRPSASPVAYQAVDEINCTRSATNVEKRCNCKTLQFYFSPKTDCESGTEDMLCSLNVLLIKVDHACNLHIHSTGIMFDAAACETGSRNSPTAATAPGAQLLPAKPSATC